ncbi:DUF1707 domain-containing protein [Nakamurella aerolata]|uniref:DUF1707 domain-containing protein n=1 Tax=Nakamurella aerolata TaxID=1656892 RepID=A0A849A6S0_9ACTN|nr:DUF1707 domain-containing protein [Nakamurella aerolata]
MSENPGVGASSSNPAATPDPAPSAPPPVRIGNSERDAALQALGVHMRAGRLSPDEYSERANHVATATNQLQLNAQFVDLPGGYGSAASTGNSGVAGPVELAKPAAPATAASAQPQPKAGFDANRLVAIAGALAVPLLLICGFVFDGWAWSWLFIFLPAIVAAVVRAGRD